MRLFISLLFPPWCQSCGRFGAWMCERCWSHVQFVANARRPASSFPSLWGVWSLARYDPHVGKVLQAFKYQGVRVLAKPLGEALTRQSGDWLKKHHVEALIPVPLHPKRYNRRGYNQAGLLAQVVGEKTEITVAWRALERVAWATTQAKQGRSGRIQLQYSFRCPQKLTYECVCLVDDVTTTGATLSACARALNQAGVKKVVAITIARAE